MVERPRGADLIVTGDLNLNFQKAGGWGRYEEIAAAVTTAGLEDLAGHFPPRRRAWFKDRRTWAVVRQGSAVRSRTEYILGSDRFIF